MGGDTEEFINTPRPKNDVFDAATWCDLDALKDFIEQKDVPVNATNVLKQTALHISAAHRCMALLDYLLNKDSSLVSLKDKWGQTALHLAIQKGYMEIVEYLINDYNSDIYQMIDSRNGNTAIHLAAEECRLEMMIFFIEQKKGDVNVRNALGEPPIFSAASNNHLDMVQYLMSKGASATLVDKNDDNILYVSAKRGDLRIPKYLLDEKKLAFDVNWRDNSGETVLHRAVKYNQLNFIKYFVEKKQADMNIYDNLDRTPVYIATEMGNLDIVKYLVERGSDYKLNDVEGKIPFDIVTDERVKEYLSSLKQKRRRRQAFQPSFYISMREDLKIRELSPRLLAVGDFHPKPLANLVHTQVDNFLTLADVTFRYFASSTYQRKKHESLLSPEQILENRIDPVAVNAILYREN